MLTRKEKHILSWLRGNSLVDMLYKATFHPNAVGQFMSGNAGWQWEDELKEMLDDKEIPWFPSPKLNERHELIVNGMTVQCKFSGLGPKKKHAPISHNGHTMLYNIGDYDVLALKILWRGRTRYFFIPAEELHNRKKPGKLMGVVNVEKIGRWEDAWWVLAQTPQPNF